MKLCKHMPHKVIDWVKEPKYSTDEILIKTEAVSPEIEHYLIKFTACNKYPDWFYMSGKVIRRFHTQKNGNGTVYVVPMGKREEFIADNRCGH